MFAAMDTLSSFDPAPSHGAGRAGDGTRLALGLLAGFLIAVAVMGAIYAAAAATASSMAASFNTTETARHAHTIEFATAAVRDGAEYRMAREAPASRP